MKGYWLLAFGVGALSPLSDILVLSAIEMGAPLGLVAHAREMSMMVGAMFGMLILGERVTAWQRCGLRDPDRWRRALNYSEQR